MTLPCGNCLLPFLDTLLLLNLNLHQRSPPAVPRQNEQLPPFHTCVMTAYCAAPNGPSHGQLFKLASVSPQPLPQYRGGLHAKKRKMAAEPKKSYWRQPSKASSFLSPHFRADSAIYVKVSSLGSQNLWMPWESMFSNFEGEFAETWR